MERPRGAAAHQPAQPQGVDQGGAEAWRPMASSRPDSTPYPVKRKHWPFLFYEEGGQMFHNPAIKTKEQYEEALL